MFKHYKTKRQLKTELEIANDRALYAESKLSMIEYKLRNLIEKDTNPYTFIRDIKCIIYPQTYKK